MSGFPEVKLDAKIRARLLRVAGEAILGELAGDAGREVEIHGAWPPMGRRGAFVTLRFGGHLRGCVGTFQPPDELPQTVRSLALAAMYDDRFADQSWSISLLDGLRIEISVLSPLRKIPDPLAFEIGIHGVYVRVGRRGGCFLPEVAVEQGWDRETFLSQCCAHKAGLEPSAWRRPEAEVFVFDVDKITAPK